MLQVKKLKRNESDDHLPSTMRHDKDFAMGSDDFSDASYRSGKESKDPTGKGNKQQLTLADLTPHERLMFKLKIAIQKRKAAIVKQKKEAKKGQNQKLGITIAAIGSEGQRSIGNVTPLEVDHEEASKGAELIGDAKIKEPMTALPPQVTKL